MKGYQKYFALIFVTCFIIIAYGVLIEPFLVDVRHVWIHNDSLSKVLGRKSVVHISDLHIKSIGAREKNVLKLIEDLSPDLIFMTGDYVQWRGDYEPALDFLSKLKASIGVYAVMGDYAYSSSTRSCLFCHEPGTGAKTQRHSVRFLSNTTERIRLPEGDIWVTGLSVGLENYFFSKNSNPFPEGHLPAIVLSHEPQAFDLLNNNQDILMLAGSTHGGQIPVPSALWRFLGYEKCFQYCQGFFEEGRKKMYVNRGIGTSHMPIRLLRRPEITVLHFCSANEH